MNPKEIFVPVCVVCTLILIGLAIALVSYKKRRFCINCCHAVRVKFLKLMHHYESCNNIPPHLTRQTYNTESEEISLYSDGYETPVIRDSFPSMPTNSWNSCPHIGRGRGNSFHDGVSNRSGPHFSILCCKGPGNVDSDDSQSLSPSAVPPPLPPPRLPPTRAPEIPCRQPIPAQPTSSPLAPPSPPPSPLPPPLPPPPPPYPPPSPPPYSPPSLPQQLPPPPKPARPPPRQNVSRTPPPPLPPPRRCSYSLPKVVKPNTAQSPGYTVSVARSEKSRTFSAYGRNKDYGIPSSYHSSRAKEYFKSEYQQAHLSRPPPKPCKKYRSFSSTTEYTTNVSDIIYECASDEESYCSSTQETSFTHNRSNSESSDFQRHVGHARQFHLADNLNPTFSSTFQSSRPSAIVHSYINFSHDSYFCSRRPPLSRNRRVRRAGGSRRLILSDYFFTPSSSSSSGSSLSRLSTTVIVSDEHINEFLAAEESAKAHKCVKERYLNI